MRFTFLLAAWLCVPVIAAAQSKPSGQSSRPGWPCAGKVDPAYVHVAEASGGKVLLFHPTEIEGAGIDYVASNRHDETIFRSAGQLADQAHEVTVPIDSTIESVYFVVSVQCLQVVSLITPTGDELAAGLPGVEYHQFEAVRLYVVGRPAPGLWKVRAAGRGFFSMIVAAKTDLRLGAVSLLNPTGSSVTLEAGVSGAFRHAEFHFVAGNGELIKSLQLGVVAESDDGRRYAGAVTRPRTNFRVAVTGLDPSGFAFQRMESRLSDGGPSPR